MVLELSFLSLSSFFIKMYYLLGSKTLGLNVLELQFLMLANHDENVLVLFRFAQSICFLCKVGIK